jgi:hypothetical protein
VIAHRFSQGWRPAAMALLAMAIAGVIALTRMTPVMLR